MLLLNGFHVEISIIVCIHTTTCDRAFTVQVLFLSLSTAMLIIIRNYDNNYYYIIRNIGTTNRKGKQYTVVATYWTRFETLGPLQFINLMKKKKKKYTNLFFLNFNSIKNIHWDVCSLVKLLTCVCVIIMCTIYCIRKKITHGLNWKIKKCLSIIADGKINNFFLLVCCIMLKRS